MVRIHGSCDARFAGIREAFERNFTERGDVGASFAMTVEGEFVVDIWGGHRDAAATEPWVEDTIVNDERGFSLWRAVFESLGA